ncbi:hypothetical protein Aeh1ORF285c [Aeromonas phage Aeh1]|uniref:Uncharacterized protein n=1 Tax=Aeromonas phage Aeh1 TaxID=2880362 RepID=Q76YE1_9CAUD|nr:hypothetical protein Aeh1p304 [Aeromonas phage Aeh1]AAQ17954.1 hypothetical protein Aeh1ORF285c [Aeromonas phage Aeh1]
MKRYKAALAGTIIFCGAFIAGAAYQERRAINYEMDVPTVWSIEMQTVSEIIKRQADLKEERKKYYEEEIKLIDVMRPENLKKIQEINRTLIDNSHRQIYYTCKIYRIQDERTEIDLKDGTKFMQDVIEANKICKAHGVNLDE